MFLGSAIALNLLFRIIFSQISGLIRTNYIIIDECFDSSDITNKEKLKEKRSQLINCDCGNQYTYANKQRHLQSKYHSDFKNKLCGIISEPLKQISEEEKIQILKQKQKEYREKNAEKIKEFKKKYNDTHKKENSEACKKYYNDNKKKIIEKNKIYADENKDKIKERNVEWYKKNKEKILGKQNELFSCECGSKVRISGKAEHNKSIKHTKYIDCFLDKDILLNI